MTCLDFDTIRRDPKLPSTAFRVADYLNTHTRRCYDECFRSTETIARFIGRSVSTVQRALKCLALKGYLLVVPDRSLNSGHRICLGWRTATIFPAMRPAGPDPFSAPNASENVDLSAIPEAEMRPEIVPPRPPIEVSEDKTLGGDDDAAPAGDPDPPAEEQSSSSPALRSLPPEEEEPEEDADQAIVLQETEAAAVAAAIVQAEAIFPDAPGIAGFVKAQARRFTIDWVLVALGITARKAAKETVTPGWVIGILNQFQAQGGPLQAKSQAPAPPPPTVPLKTFVERADELRAQRQREGYNVTW